MLEQRALEAAMEHIPRLLRRRATAAIETYMRSAHFTEEFAVPCLPPRPCRSVYTDRASAEKGAISERVNVIESRQAGPWRPLPDWPPDDEVTSAPQRPPT